MSHIFEAYNIGSTYVASSTVVFAGMPPFQHALANLSGFDRLTNGYQPIK